MASAPVPRADRFPDYARLLSPGGANTWRQAFLEASLAWAAGPAYRPTGRTEYSFDSHFLPQPCLGELGASLQGVQVTVVPHAQAVLQSETGWGVDPGQGLVWVSDALVDQSVSQEADGWANQGWAEFWARAALALQGLDAKEHPLVLEAQKRRRLDTQWVVEAWAPPSVGHGTWHPSPVPVPPSFRWREDLVEAGFGLAKNGSVPWDTSYSEWLHWAKAARWLETSCPIPEQHPEALAFVEQAVSREEPDAVAFWRHWSVLPEPEKHAAILGRAASPAVVQELLDWGLLPQGGVPEAISPLAPPVPLLRHALTYQPAVAVTLVKGGAQWTDLRDPSEAWALVLKQFGESTSQEWTGLFEAIDSLKSHAIPMVAPEAGEMLKGFLRNRQYRTRDASQAPQVLLKLIETLDWSKDDCLEMWDQAAHGFPHDYFPAVEALNAKLPMSLALSESPIMMRKIWNSFSFSGTKSAPALAADWEALGMVWPMPEENADEFIELLWKTQQARLKHETLNEAWKPVAGRSPRSRM